jgi:hypothetical protein
LLRLVAFFAETIGLLESVGATRGALLETLGVALAVALELVFD